MTNQRKVIIIFVIILAFLISYALSDFGIRILVISILFIVLLSLLINLKLTNLIYLKTLTVLAFFPIPIHISGISLGLVPYYCIVLYFLYVNVGLFLFEGRVKFKIDFPISVMVSLIFVAIVSTFLTYGNHNVFRESLWSGILIISCICYYLILHSIPIENEEERVKITLELLNIFIFMISLQIFISLLERHSIHLSTFFDNLFGRSYRLDNIERINIQEIDERMSTFSLPPESLGEALAVISPIIFFKLFNKVSVVSIFYTIAMLVGLYMAATRSGAILTLFSFGISMMMFGKTSSKKIVAALLLLSIVIISSYFANKDSYLFRRLNDSYQIYISGGTSLEVANRSFFEDNWSYFLSKLSLFGNGLVSPLMYKVLRIDFHNLYMTLTFQFGIIGAILYLLLPITLLVRLIKSFLYNKTDIIYFVFSVSLGIFFLNELKYEFTRKPSYVLLIWILFSIYSFSLNKSCKK